MQKKKKKKLIIGVTYGYNDVCLTDSLSNQPVFYNILAFWGYDRALLESQDLAQIQATLASPKK